MFFPISSKATTPSAIVRNGYNWNVRLFVLALRYLASLHRTRYKTRQWSPVTPERSPFLHQPWITLHQSILYLIHYQINTGTPEDETLHKHKYVYALHTNCFITFRLGFFRKQYFACHAKPPSVALRRRCSLRNDESWSNRTAQSHHTRWFGWQRKSSKIHIRQHTKYTYNICLTVWSTR